MSDTRSDTKISIDEVSHSPYIYWISDNSSTILTQFKKKYINFLKTQLILWIFNIIIKIRNKSFWITHEKHFFLKKPKHKSLSSIYIIYNYIIYRLYIYSYLCPYRINIHISIYAINKQKVKRWKIYKLLQNFIKVIKLYKSIYFSSLFQFN